MTLYEATNRYVGEAYVRCYVWADNETRALELATAKFFNKEFVDGTRYSANVTLKELMYDHSREFVTEVSDSGWENE